MNVYSRSPPPQVTLHHNLHHFSADLQHIRWLIFIIWLLHRLQMPRLYPQGPTHPDSNIKSIYTQSAWCDAYSTVCAVLRLRCLAQGRCGVAVAGTVPLGIREPRRVFRPPAGKYTFNATESAGAGGKHRIHDHFRWFTLKRRRCEGLAGKIPSVSTRRLCSAFALCES